MEHAIPSWPLLLLENCIETPVMQLMIALNRADASGEVLVAMLQDMLSSQLRGRKREPATLIGLLSVLKQLVPSANLVMLVATWFISDDVHPAVLHRAEMLVTSMIDKLIQQEPDAERKKGLVTSLAQQLLQSSEFRIK